jgi:hypothetical protein
MNEFLGTTLVPSLEDVIRLVARLGLNLMFVVVAVRIVYFRRYQHRDYVFTYFLLNVVTFLVAFLLSQVPIELGFALGLFAVFGILRYRTEAIRVRELTYLFVVIGIALLNALAGEQISLVELVLVNTVIVATVAALEAAPFSGREESRRVLYDRLELLGPDTAAELLADLRSRTRLPVDRYEIGNVDLLRDTAEITVYSPVRRWSV